LSTFFFPDFFSFLNNLLQFVSLRIPGAPQFAKTTFPNFFHGLGGLLLPPRLLFLPPPTFHFPIERGQASNFYNESGSPFFSAAVLFACSSFFFYSFFFLRFFYAPYRLPPCARPLTRPPRADSGASLLLVFPRSGLFFSVVSSGFPGHPLTSRRVTDE